MAKNRRKFDMPNKMAKIGKKSDKSDKMKNVSLFYRTILSDLSYCQTTLTPHF